MARYCELRIFLEVLRMVACSMLCNPNTASRNAAIKMLPTCWQREHGFVSAGQPPGLRSRTYCTRLCFLHAAYHQVMDCHFGSTPFVEVLTSNQLVLNQKYKTDHHLLGAHERKEQCVCKRLQSPSISCENIFIFYGYLNI
jgi:hypothetical protein